MKIISYNVNGIRAAMKKGLINWLENESPDIVCFQEIKALEDQIDTEEFKKIGYKYNYWFSAQKKATVVLRLFQNTNLKMLNLERA